VSRRIDSLFRRAIEEGLTKKLLEELLIELDGTTNSVSRRNYLAIKHGNVGAVQRVYRQLTNCNCSAIHRETTLENQDEYIKCSDAVELAEKSGLLSIIQQPIWSDQTGFEINPTRFLKCNACGLIWQLSKPERNHAGAWRLA
jgi:hypothetical protein